MKKIVQILSVVAFMSVTAFGGNLPNIGAALSQSNFNAGSTGNFFLIAVNDGDPGVTQNVTVTASSSNTGLVSVQTISYNSANTFATVPITVIASPTVVGVVTVTITAMDSDGSTSKDFQVNVGDFYTKGAEFKVYDIIFWQQIVPVTQSPKMDVVIPNTAIPTANTFYLPAKLTVGAGLACCGYFTTDQEYSYGFTNAVTGYIKPTISGTYSFANISENGATFFINTITGDLPGGDLYSGTISNTCSGLACPTSLYLEAGKYYGFHTANWIVYNKTYQFVWSGPGINSYQPIAPPNVYPLYDRINPTAPTALTLVNKGVHFLTLRWKSATDNDKVASYNLYQDGVLLTNLNDSLYVATFLGANTLYSYAVTALDRVGNESAISNIISTTTYNTDVTPPTPPTNISFISSSDMSAEISWTGAKDVGSEVIGYYVYLNGKLYNTQYTTDSSIVLKVLVPKSTDTVSVVAFDGAFNNSPKSANTVFTMNAFDETKVSVGVKKAKVVIYPTAIARNPGFGLNYGWGNSAFYTTTPSIFKQYIGDIKPGLLRWGDLSANPCSFSSYVGTGKSVTIGDFMQLCADNDAYAEFTCGVKNDTDWMLNSSTFTRFMEYIGDATGQTPGGQQRIAEGFIDPFTSTVKGIIIEFGNEVWGGDAHNASIGDDYTTYGQWCRQMAAIIKSSPYYDPNIIFMSYSGRDPDPGDSYALNQKLLLGDHHEVDWISLSGYMGGNLGYDSKVPSGTSELLYYKSSTKVMTDFLAGLKSTMDQDLGLTGSYRPFYFYEANMTTPDYNGRLGQGVVMCDYFFSAMKLGVAVPAIFALSGGEWSITDASNGNAKLPFFNIAELMNANTKGNILKSTVNSIEVLADENGLRYTQDPVGVHVFNDGSTNYGIAFFSREFDSDYQVEIVLPKNGVYGTKVNGKMTAKRYLITSTDFSQRVATTSQSTVAFKDSMIITVPAYSTLLYLFDGPDMGQQLLPLGYTKYKKIDQIQIVVTSELGNANIDTQYGSASFTVAGISQAVINKGIGWNIGIPEGSSITFDSTSGSNIKIFGSGLCSGNGVVTVTAFSLEDPNVNDQILVTITGQLDENLTSCDETQGIKDPLSGKVVISPNPTSGTVSIFSSALKLNQVDIYNTGGGLVFSKTFQSGIQSYNCDLSSLPKGLYFVKLRTPEGLATKKLVLQ